MRHVDSKKKFLRSHPTRKCPSDEWKIPCIRVVVPVVIINGNFSSKCARMVPVALLRPGRELTALLVELAAASCCRAARF